MVETLVREQSYKNKQIYIDNNIYYGIDILHYYENIYGKRNNIMISGDLSIASSSGNLFLTDRIKNRADAPEAWL